MIIENSHKGIK